MKAPVDFTCVSAALRLSVSPGAAALSRTLIGALQAGVLRRERPGSPNTRFCEVGEGGEVLVDEGVAGAAEAGEAVFHVRRIARLRHLAVVDEVDPRLGLLLHDLRHCRAHARGQGRRVDRDPLLLRIHDADQVVRARQAAGVRRQKPVGAVDHALSPFCLTRKESAFPRRGQAIAKNQAEASGFRALTCRLSIRTSSPSQTWSIRILPIRARSLG